MWENKEKIFHLLVVLTGFFATPLLAAEPNGFNCVVEPNMVVELSSRVDGIIE